MVDLTKARGLLCQAVYEGSQFRMWEGPDKKNGGAIRMYRNLTHQFSWENDAGSDFLVVVDWLPKTSTVSTLAECKVPYQYGMIYDFNLLGLEVENRTKKAHSRVILAAPDQSKLAAGLILEAFWGGAQFNKFDGQDKENPGRVRTSRTLKHRWIWQNENGLDFCSQLEYLPLTSGALTIKDCQLSYNRETIYHLALQGLISENGIKSCQSRDIQPLVQAPEVPANQ